MRAVYWLLAGIVVPLAFACGASVKVADPLPLSESESEGPAVALPIPEDQLIPPATSSNSDGVLSPSDLETLGLGAQVVRVIDGDTI